MIDKDDVGAIASRIDAQTVVLIELISELANREYSQMGYLSDKYTRRYDELASKYREEIVS